MRKILFTILTLSVSFIISAQTVDTLGVRSSPFKQYVPQEQLDAYNLKQIHLSRDGMYVLSAWGLANLVYGAVAVSITHGEAQAFHTSNLAWGGVNLLIGLPGVLSSYRKDKGAGVSFGRTVLRQHGVEKIYLINGALDFAYIGAGAALWGFSDRLTSERTRNIFSGAGKSFIMQGSFLLCFDWSMYLLHSQHAYRELNRYVAGLSWSGDGLSYRLMF